MALTIQQRAAQDLAAKITLENQFIPKLTNLFNRVADDFYQSMARDGVPPVMSNWQTFFEEMLLSHYQATGDVFSHRIRDQLNLKVTEQENNSILAALGVFFTGLAADSSKQITDTNQAQADDAIRRMQLQQAIDYEETGQLYDRPTQARVSKNIFTTGVMGRVPTIAISETQTAAESSKYVESDVINYRDPTINDPFVSTINQTDTKTWVATLDSRTRPTHVKADGQTVKAGEFFIVGGFKMMRPGDRSAPISEWINCRCEAIYNPSNEAINRRL